MRASVYKGSTYVGFVDDADNGIYGTAIWGKDNPFFQRKRGDLVRLGNLLDSDPGGVFTHYKGGDQAGFVDGDGTIYTSPGRAKAWFVGRIDSDGSVHDTNDNKIGYVSPPISSLTLMGGGALVLGLFGHVPTVLDT